MHYPAVCPAGCTSYIRALLHHQYFQLVAGQNVCRRAPDHSRTNDNNVNQADQLLFGIKKAVPITPR
jgi:hypothetical protein